MAALAVTAATLSMVAAGCSSGGGDTASTSRGEASADVAPPSTVQGAPDAVAGAAGPSEPSGQQASSVAALDASPAQLGRKVVSTGSITVSGDDVGALRSRVVLIAAQVGGFLFDETSNFGDSPTIALTLKVPPDQFQPTLEALSGLGSVVARTVSTDDVTQQVIDLDARVATAQASVARVRALFDRATSVADVTQLEGELSRREAELESLRGQQRTLAGRTDLATVTATLTTATAPPPSPADTSPGFTDGLRNGWEALVDAARVSAIVVGAMLPFVPFALVGGGVWVLVRRRRGRPKTPSLAGGAP